MSAAKALSSGATLQKGAIAVAGVRGHDENNTTRSASGISVDSAPLLYHTDGDVVAIAARIGEKID